MQVLDTHRWCSVRRVCTVRAHLTYERHFPDQTLWREALAAGSEAASLAPEAPAPRRFPGQAYATVQWYSRAWTA